MNEFTTIFSGAESNFLLDVQALLGKGTNISNAKALLPIWFDSLMYSNSGLNEFGLRLPNVIILILTFVGFYFYGKKIFGVKTTAVTLLVIGSSFLPVNFAKLATGDTWLFGAQLMSFVMMILYLKQPIVKWKWGVWIMVVLGALIHPMSMFVWSLGMWGYLQMVHPKGKNLKGLILLPLVLVTYLPLYFFGYVTFDMPHFLMGIGSGNFKYFFVFTLLGILPWFGFLPASIWDMIQKLRKKEELAIITFGWILFSIFSQGMVILAALSFIIAKNLLAFFQKNYPYRRWVKGFTLLNMIFTFVILFGALLGGFLNFKGMGYRSVLGVSMLYWMASMAAVLGLFMTKNSLVTGGMAVSGLMATWLLWLQVNPLLDSQRSFPKEVYQTLRKDGVGKNASVTQPTEIYHLNTDSIFYQNNFQVYLQDLNLVPIPIDSTNFVNIGSKDQKAWAAIPSIFIDQLPQNHIFKNNRKLQVSGGKGFLQIDVAYQLVEF